jgi:hypothetical protein
MPAGSSEWTHREVVRLSARTGQDACVAEQSGRNDTIGFARKAHIERTDRKPTRSRKSIEYGFGIVPPKAN